MAGRGEIARRLQTDPISTRRDDLLLSAQWLADSVGVGVEDLAVTNVGPIQNVAGEIIQWLGWT